MVEKNKIIIGYFTDAKKISEIANELKISRNTVRKYINEQKLLQDSSQLDDQISKGLSTKPKYTTSNRIKIKLTEEVVNIIKICLAENKKKRNNRMTKQQMKKIDIHEYLLSLGHDVGYTTVCNYVRKHENKRKEAFIKQKFTPGSTCEFDWGEVKIKVDGKVKKFNMAVFTSAFSNHRFAKLFHRQDTLAFVQSHIDYFEEIGYIFKEIVYDNMRVAVARFVGSAENRATNSLLEMSNYYQFGFRFCNIRKGNEKGHVERSVEYIRRKAFSLKSDFTDLKEANQYLLEKCKVLNGKSQKTKDNQTANNLLEEEIENLSKTKIAYQCFEELMVKVNKYSTVSIRGNHYSVPDFLVSKMLTARVFAEKIIILLHEEIVCHHTRSYSSHHWSISIEHFIYTFNRKLGALKGSLAFDQIQKELQTVFYEYFQEDVKGFIILLQNCVEKDIQLESIFESVSYLKIKAPNSITRDSIIATIDKRNDTINIKKSVSQSSLDIINYAQVSLDKLTQTLKYN